MYKIRISGFYYFNPRPREGGGDHRPPCVYQKPYHFNPRPREGGATIPARPPPGRPSYFNPRPREGGRLPKFLVTLIKKLFQSTPPRGGGDPSAFSPYHLLRISIHAPARGGDRRQHTVSRRFLHFNPRPREGGRLISASIILAIFRFQSTPPRGGATAKMHSFTCGSLTNK